MRIKDEKKNKRYLAKGLFFLGAAGLGFLLAFLSDGVLEGFLQEYINAATIFMVFVNIVFMLLVLILGFIIHIIIHELGHLIFGLISGYKFVSFRLGSVTLIREEKGFQFKKFNIPGTGGQCLMMPPDKKYGDFPFIIYNLGGVIANILFSLGTILIAVSIEESPVFKLILILISISGIFAGLTNAIPLKVGGISNDGHNTMTMIKNNDSKESFYLQLRVNGLQSEGFRLRDMAYEEFKLVEGRDYTNPLNFSRILLNHNYHLDRMDFQGVEEALDFGERYFYDTIAVYQMELSCEKMFLELIGDADPKIIQRLYDEDLQKYIKASKFMLNKKRIMMAYEAFYNKDKEKALKYYQELKSLAQKYPVKGEADMELMLGEYIKERMDQGMESNLK